MDNAGRYAVGGVFVVILALLVYVVATPLMWGRAVEDSTVQVQVSGPFDEYGRLFPAPDAVAWQQGRESVLWLDTNLEGAELRILGLDNGNPGAPALGLGVIQVRSVSSGELLTLG